MKNQIAYRTPTIAQNSTELNENSLVDVEHHRTYDLNDCLHDNH